MIKKITDLYKRPLIRDTINTTVLSTIGKGAGFLIPFFIAAWFGVTSETDAFFFAYGLILFLSGIFAPVVESVIVPYIAEARTNNEDVGKFVGNILCVSGLALLVLALVFILLIKPLLSVITRFDPQSLALIHRLLIETAPLVIFLTWTSILAGTLNTYKKFAFPAISPAFRAVVNIAIIFAFKDKYGIHAVAFGYVIGEFVRLVILFIIIEKLKLFKLTFSLHFGAKLKLFFKTASFQTISMAAFSFNAIIGRAIASWLEEGSVSLLYYAERLYIIPVTFLSTGLMITLLSHWSNKYSKLNIEGLKRELTKVIKIVIVISLLILSFLFLFREQIVELLYGRNSVTSDQLIEVQKIWLFYLFGFIPGMLERVFSRGHLVLKNTKIIMVCSLYSIFINILLTIALIKYFGVSGIALASTFVLAFTSSYLGVLFYRAKN